MAIKFANYKSSVVELKQGINENVSSLELTGGELLNVKNYMMAEGGYGGYQSVRGYERIDGAIIPSKFQSLIMTIENCTVNVDDAEIVTGGTTGATALSLGTGDLISGTFIGGDAIIELQCAPLTDTFVPVEDITTVANGLIGDLTANSVMIGGNETYHQGLDYARTLVQEVPGEGIMLGVYIFERNIYAFRKKVGVDEIGMYVEDSTGWLEVDTSSDPIVYSGSHDFKFDTYNFYAGVDTNSMFWVDGKNQTRAYDGTTVSTIDNTGMSSQALDAPTHLAAHNFHLFLAYRGGSLQFSGLGDPTVWDGVLGASEIGLGGEITNLVAGVQSSLVIYLESAIRSLTGNSIDDWILEVFSDNTGGYEDTARRLLGTVFSVNDRGLSTLQAVQEYGDYGSNSVSQRFKQTLFKNKNSITTALVSRDLNQYRLYFEDKTSIYVSFEAKEMQGATFCEFPHQVAIASEGEDVVQDELIVFCSEEEDGYVFKMESGTSFDGTAITCRMSTAFFHYGSPRQYKAFKRATFEISSESGQSFDMKVDFDYNELGSPRTIWYCPTIYNTEGGAIYGEGKWGTMKYGTAQAVTNRVPIYLQGVGTNMSYKIISNETYREQHVIQNVITDYSIVGRRI